ncbi:MAG: N-acetylmuramoyl-L-alanine amidase [Oscillospiraceae bacterium]
MKILLIAGHGGSDPGACAQGARECDLARNLVPQIRASLAQYGAEAAIYNTARSAYHDLIAMGYAYNFKPYDYVLEVHFNACVNDFMGDGRVTGSEIYVTRDERKTYAEDAILRRMATIGFKNRGVKRKNYSVIMEAKRQGVSSALLEVCFMDDSDDMKLYNKNTKKIAAAIADGIAEGYKLKSKNDAPETWAKAAWDKAKKLGITDGQRPHDACTREELVTMLHRAGVIK